MARLARLAFGLLLVVVGLAWCARIAAGRFYVVPFAAVLVLGVRNRFKYGRSLPRILRRDRSPAGGVVVERRNV